jgi:hexosaminidase
MIKPMDKNSKHVLDCMPWPAHVEAFDRSTAVLASLEKTTFRYLSIDDSRVRQYAERELDDCTLGLLEIDISGDEAEALPSVSMDESYGLNLADGVISLSSNTAWGAMRGLATLAQLARHRQLFAGLTIEDSPRFPWRGLLLDVARHFFPVQSLKSVVDGLAALKMNVLHLHLSDDQACRFPQRGLSQIGQRRALFYR